MREAVREDVRVLKFAAGALTKNFKLQHDTGQETDRRRTRREATARARRADEHVTEGLGERL